MNILNSSIAQSERTSQGESFAASEDEDVALQQQAEQTGWVQDEAGNWVQPEPEQATPEAAEPEARSGQEIRDALPTKAREYLARSERELVRHIRTVLDIPHAAGQELLQEIAERIGNEYLEKGTISRQAMDEIFEDAYSRGVKVDEEYYNDHKDVKGYIRKTRITLDEGYKSSIPDFDLWRKANFGTVNLVNEGGMSVDSALTG